MKKRFLAVILLSAMLATSALSGCGCSGPSATADETVETSVQTVTEIATDEQGNTFVTESTKVVEVKETQSSIEATEKATQQATSAEKTNSKNNESVPATTKPSTSSTQSKASSSASSSKTSSNANTANSSTSSKNNNSNSSSGSSQASSGKTWHEAVYKTVNHPAETEKVWVVDKEAYTYEETLFERRCRYICCFCGKDITDDPTKGTIIIEENGHSHAANHAIKGEEPSSYRNEYIWYDVKTNTKATDEQLDFMYSFPGNVGYYETDENGDTCGYSDFYHFVRIITVPEEGHWETKVVKEAWTERVLVKEAGYY